MEREMINNDFYDELEEQWYTAEDHPIALLRAENATRTPWVIDQLKKHFPDKSCSILDIGCGGGFLTNALAKEKHSVVGIDLSEESLSVARQKDETHSVIYQKEDAYALPFQKESFDVVCSMDFLEHVEKPEKIIAQAAHVLKPGGLFFFHTFNRNPFCWLVALKGVEWFVKNTPKNMHLYRLFIKPKELQNYCHKHDLQILSFQGLAPNIKQKGFWKMLCTRRVPKEFSFQMTSSLLCGYMGVAKRDIL